MKRRSLTLPEIKVIFQPAVKDTTGCGNWAGKENSVSFTLIKTALKVKSTAYPVWIYVDLVRVFGWKEIFIDNAFNLALCPLSTWRLNITNLHIKTKGNQCWPANIPNIQNPTTNKSLQGIMQHSSKTFWKSHCMQNLLICTKINMSADTIWGFTENIEWNSHLKFLWGAVDMNNKLMRI